MEIIVDDKAKLVEVWLTKAEASCESIDKDLKPIYEEYTKRKYKTVVFRSGKGSLDEHIETLIRRNKIKFAEQDIKNIG
jgi:hypothetical protein